MLARQQRPQASSDVPADMNMLKARVYLMWAKRIRRAVKAGREGFSVGDLGGARALERAARRAAKGNVT